MKIGSLFLPSEKNSFLIFWMFVFARISAISSTCHSICCGRSCPETKEKRRFRRGIVLGIYLYAFSRINSSSGFFTRATNRPKVIV